jgi:hypothetical protein
MKRKMMLGVMMAAVILFIGTGLYAAGEFKDKISLQEPSYPHTKGAVEFSHAKHVDEYKATCGECHHDENNKPLEVKKGDAVKKCVECHTKPGEIKGKEAKGMSAKDKRQYHANALHDNCRGCHKTHNEKNNTKAAPTTCAKCHPKTE